MPNRRHPEVQPRNAAQLFPPTLDDDVAAANPVGAMDADVGMLDRRALGFRHANARTGSGQPPFDPAILRKLSIEGYPNQTRSSRPLEKATRLHGEGMGLCQNVRPGYKTIADCRNNNRKALQQGNRALVRECRDRSLLGGSRVAVDGTFRKASAHRGSVRTKASLERGRDCLDKRIESHYRAMDEEDASAPEGKDLSDPDRVAKREAWLERRARKKALQEQLEASGDTQASEGDPAARLWRKNGKSVVGYNGQIAVDDKAKWIVATDRVQDGNDSQQREPMMTQASAAMASEGWVGLADTGYSNGDPLKGGEDRGMAMEVPRPDNAGRSGKDGRFGSEDFPDDSETDSVAGPAGRKLVPNGSTSMSRGKRDRVYRSNAKVCGSCPLASRCLPRTDFSRRISRWEHADGMDRHREGMANDKGDVMGLRGFLVEHPFGTLKVGSGVHHFRMRGLATCRGECDRMVLCYNCRRVLQEIGVGAFVAYCRAQKAVQGMGMGFCPGRSVFSGPNRHSWRWVWGPREWFWKTLA